MAELDVQPKRKSPWWIWLLIALIILTLLFLLRGCNNDKITTRDRTDSTSNIEATTVPDWNSVDFNAPDASYEEISDTAISVRGNDNYTIYGLGENILFAAGESTVRPDAKKQLEQISASLKKRFNEASVAVYGNTDATGDAGKNKELGEQRAESVKKWLVANAGISDDKISLRSKGESDPVASNATSQGRKMNRRVEIVVMK